MRQSASQQHQLKLPAENTDTGQMTMLISSNNSYNKLVTSIFRLPVVSHHPGMRH